GAARMRFAVYALYSALGGVLWGAAVPLLGYYLGKIAFIRDHVDLILVGAVVIVVFFAILPLAFEVWRRRRIRSAAANGQPAAGRGSRSTAGTDSRPTAGTDAR